MNFLSFVNVVIVFGFKVSALIVSLSILNVANASSHIVSIEDMGLYNWEAIEEKLPGYGSNGPVVLNWNPDNDFFTELLAYNFGYSGRAGAFCWNGENCALELSVNEENSSIKLDSFFLGYFGYGEVVEFDVIDLETEASILSGSPWVDGISGSLVTVDASSNAGFRILFGPDGFNGGINNISYSYDSGLALTPAVIPIPAAVWLFGSGLFGVFGFSRQPVSRVIWG